MIGTMLLCGAFFAGPAGTGEPPPNPQDLDAYAAAKAKVGKNPDAQVKLALWCEAHGLSAERNRHLMLAILIDPNHVTARGLVGLVASDGKWEKPADVSQQLASDAAKQALVQEYLKRRAATAGKPEAQWKLAQWCEQSGLSEQAKAHYWTVIRLAPRREAAWKKLGYKKSGEGWAKPEQVASEKAEAERQRQATKHWRPILERQREELRSKDPARRTRAERALAQVTDPRAVSAVWDVLAKGDERLQLKAVQVLGQIDGPAASRAVAALAILSPSPSVRGRAIDTAARRDPRDFLDSLLSMIHRPFRYKVQSINGPGSEGGVFVDGERFNIRRLYQIDPLDPSRIDLSLNSPTSPFNPLSAAGMIRVSSSVGGMLNFALPVSPAAVQQPGRAIAANPTAALTSLAHQPLPTNATQGNPAYFVYARQADAIVRDQVIAGMLNQIQQNVQQVQQSLAQDVQTVESWNAGIREVNERVLPIVKYVTGQDFGTDQDAWLKWWNDQLGYVYQSPSTEQKPTYTQVSDYDFNPPQPPHCACFAAGTSVQTIDGVRPIEKVLVGDQVLSQNTTSGALSFQPVIVIHHNPPSPTLKLRLGEETVVATGIHRFWKAGKGWTMARELTPGDEIRTVGGSVRLESVEPGPVQPVFNLDIAGNRDFFVGNHGCLVYDFSIVQPVSTPFDQVPELTHLDAEARQPTREAVR